MIMSSKVLADGLGFWVILNEPCRHQQGIRSESYLRIYLMVHRVSDKAMAIFFGLIAVLMVQKSAPNISVRLVPVGPRRIIGRKFQFFPLGQKTIMQSVVFGSIKPNEVKAYQTRAAPGFWAA